MDIIGRSCRPCLRRFRIPVYFTIVLFASLNGLESREEGNTTTEKSLTTAEVELKYAAALASNGDTTQEETDVSNRCKPGSFSHLSSSAGLTRYFECCDNNELGPADCYKECPCMNGGYCDFTTKTCRCPAGMKGTYCTQDCNSEDTGRYGIECTEMCTCAEDAICDGVNGLCSCPDGDKGCMKCMVGLYGPTCKVPCMCGVGVRCDENGVCLEDQTVAPASKIGSEDDSNSTVVALGVLLGILILVILVILVAVFVSRKRGGKRKRKYISIRTNSAGEIEGEIPFEFGTGRDSVDLLGESPIQAPRNISGLLQYLNNRPQSQRSYARQPSNAGRELPDIPEADAASEPAPFLASDGTEQPVAEPISPTLHSDPSFDVPDVPHNPEELCLVTIEKSPDDTPASAPVTNQKRSPATPNLTSPPQSSTDTPTSAPITTNQISTPSIVIDYSKEPGSDHGTPLSSPSSGQRSPATDTLPVTRATRSMSSPGVISSSHDGDDYDQLDRSLRKKSYTSGVSSACDSGPENSYDQLRMRQHRRVKKSSLKRKRHSLDQLAAKSRPAVESDSTESERSPVMPSKPPRRFPLVANVGSSSGSSDHASMPPKRQYVPQTMSPVSPLSLTGDDDANKESPYLMSSLQGSKPQNDATSGDTSKTLGHPGYAKPKRKRNEGDESEKRPAKHDYFVLNINNKSSENSDEDESNDKGKEKIADSRTYTDDYEKPMPELRKQAGITIEDGATEDHDELLDQRTPMLQNDLHSTSNGGMGAPRVDDYETPMKYLKKRNEPLEDEDHTEHAETTLDDNEESLSQMTPMLQNDENTLNSSRNGDVRQRRVDDYETPIEHLRKTTESDAPGSDDVS